MKGYVTTTQLVSLFCYRAKPNGVRFITLVSSPTKASRKKIAKNGAEKLKDTWTFEAHIGLHLLCVGFFVFIVWILFGLIFPTTEITAAISPKEVLLKQYFNYITDVHVFYFAE